MKKKITHQIQIFFKPIALWHISEFNEALETTPENELKWGHFSKDSLGRDVAKMTQL